MLPVILGAVLLWAVDASAERPVRVHRIGTLDASSPDPSRLEWWSAFRLQLGELGYVEGQNISIETRFANGKLEQLSALAEELVRLRVDVIVTAGGVIVTQAAKQATTTIPMVMTTGADPVGFGLVASLARPGGNVTGLTSITSDLSGERILEVLPRVARLAVLSHQESPPSALAVRDYEAAARAARIALQDVRVRGAEELDAAFLAMKPERAAALIVIQNFAFFAERQRLADLALHHRLPTMHGQMEYVEAGGLLCYAASYPAFFRRAAVYVGKILKHTKPADLPVEQPSKFELVINLKTAKAHGLTIPQSVLGRAERMIETLTGGIPLQPVSAPPLLSLHGAQGSPHASGTAVFCNDAARLDRDAPRPHRRAHRATSVAVDGIDGTAQEGRGRAGMSLSARKWCSRWAGH